MKFNNCQYTPKKRRGLSSIVGGLIFVVLMISAFAVIGLSLDSQTDIAATGRDVAATDLKKQQEDFVLNSAQQPPGGFLEIDVTNLGQNTAEMFTVVMTNKTDAGEPTRTFDIPSGTSFLVPGDNAPTDIVSTSFLKMDIPGLGLQEEYDFKVISSLGTIKTVSIVCDGDALLCGTITPPGAPGAASLSAVIFLDGPTGINTKVSTVIMFVQNTGTAPLEDVHPVDVCGSATFPSFNPVGGAFANCTLTPADTPAGNCGVNHDGNGICLAPGQFAIFKWDGEVQGTVDDVLTFCNQVEGEEEDGTLVGPSPSPLPSCDELTIIDPNDCGLPDCSGGGGGDEDTLDERFITRPELFLTIPSPYGEGNSTLIDPQPIMRAIWGANVVNPTETTMLIQKITISAFPPASNDNTNIVKGSHSQPLICNAQDISPGRGTVPSPIVDPDLKQIDEAGSWTCPGQNTIMWFNYTDPIVLPPLSTFPFIVKLESHRPMSQNVESVLVDSTVFTTSGSFGKGNYQSTAYDYGMLANVYETTDPLNPLDIDKISTHRSNIASGSVEKFHIVLAELDLEDDSYINATSKIIVNVPRAFTDVDVIESETSTKIITTPVGVEPSVVIHPDGTTQIIATINEDIGDQTSQEAIVLTFEATAPTVAVPKLMVMYTLANGPGSNNNSVGPLSEIVLAVVPP